MVSSMVIVFLLVEVARAPNELVGGGAWCAGRRRWWWTAVKAAFEDALDVAAVRGAIAGDGECALTGSVHAGGTVLVGAADDAENRAIAHLGSRVSVEGPPHHFFYMRTKLQRPGEHALRRPVTVVLVRLGPMLRPSDGCALACVA